MLSLARDHNPVECAGNLLVRRLAAVAFLDVVGFSRLVGRDEDATVREWSALQRSVIEPRVHTWRGRIVHRAGDGIFLEFPSALDAFRWAVGVQEAITARRFAEMPLRVRVALHLGDVIDDPDGQVQGDGVNAAARLQAHAEPGGIVVSQAIANEVAGKVAGSFRDLGTLDLKNIARPVRAFRFIPGANTKPFFGRRPAPCETSGAIRRAAKWGLGLATAALVPVSLLVPIAHRSPSDAAIADTPSSHAPTPREEAIRLTEAGRAVPCAEHPCPRAWLESRGLYEQAIARDPTYGPAYSYAALAYTNAINNDLSSDEDADLRKAGDLATRAIYVAPNDAISHYARGAVLTLQPNRLEDALAAYHRSLAIDPKQPPARASVGWILLMLGRPAAAETFLSEALAEAPTHSYAAAWLTDLGTAKLFQNRDEHGVAQFRKAIIQQSPYASTTSIGLQRLESLAAALALNGDVAEARQVVAELLRQNPTLTTHSALNCDCSHEPGYLAGMDVLKRGLTLAGMPDAS